MTDLAKHRKTDQYLTFLVSIGLAVLAIFAVGGFRIGVKSYELFEIVLPAVASLAACFFAIGASAAWGRCEKKRMIGLLVASLVAYVVSGVIVCSARFDVGAVAVSRAEYDSVREFLIVGLMGITILACLVWGSVVLSRLIPMGVKQVWFERWSLSRTQLVLAVGGCILLAGLGNTFLNVTRPDFEEDFGTRMIIALSVLAGLVGFFLFVFWPSHTLTQTDRWRSQATVCAVLMATWSGLVVLFGWLSGIPASDVYVVSLLGGMVMYLVALRALGGPDGGERRARRSNARAEGEGDSAVALPHPFRKPQFCVVIPLVCLACLICFPLRYDLSILLSRESVQNRVDIARGSARLMNATNGQIRWLEGAVYQCEFDETTDPDVFRALHLSSAGYMSISNLQPGIDTTPLRRQLRGVSLTSGTITAGQFEDLVVGGGWPNFSNFSFVDTGEFIRLDSIPRTIRLNGMDQSGQVGALLGMIDVVFPSTRFVLSGEIGPADWPGIVKVCQTSPVFVSGSLRDISLKTSRGSLKNLSVNGWRVKDRQTELTDQQIDVLQNSDLALAIAPPMLDVGLDDNQFYWDIRFAFPDRFSSISIPYAQTLIRNLGIRDASIRYHWAFGINGDQAVTRLFLPMAERAPEVLEFPELKVLSFDGDWICDRRRLAWRERPANVSHLSALTELEELYFPKQTGIDDLGFLSTLTSLKHLQIRSGGQNALGLFGLEKCPSLETLTLFNAPMPSAVKRIAQLPNLKRLTIIDLESSGDGHAKRLEILKSALPGVEIDLSSFEEIAAEVPESFQKHLERLHESLKEKLFAK